MARRNYTSVYNNVYLKPTMWLASTVHRWIGHPNERKGRGGVGLESLSRLHVQVPSMDQHPFAVPLDDAAFQIALM